MEDIRGKHGQENLNLLHSMARLLLLGACLVVTVELQLQTL